MMSTPPELSPDQLYSRAIGLLSKHLEVPAPRAEGLLSKYIALLGVPLRGPFYLKPGLVTIARHGNWVTFPTNGWAYRKLKPSTPPANRVPDGEEAKHQPLSKTKIALHLAFDGDRVVGVPGSEWTKNVLIDLDVDSDDEAARRSLGRRYRVVIGALGLARHLVLRSSSSGGLHLYYRLKNSELSSDVYSRVTQRLRASGVVIESGQCEVFPHGRTNQRLPFGVGSELLKAGSLEPRWGRHPPTRGEQLAEFLKLLPLVSIGFDDLVGSESIKASRATERATPRSPGKRVGSEEPQESVSTRKDKRQTKQRAARSNIVAIETNGITGYGRRNEEAFQLITHWVGMGLDDAEVWAKFEPWLLTKVHVSRTYEKNPTQFASQLLRDLPGMLRRARTFHARSSHPSPHHSPRLHFLSPHRLSVCQLSRAAGLSVWRYCEQQLLTAADHARVQTEPDRWMRRQLAKLIGVLRVALKETKSATIVIGKNDWAGICGHGKVPAHYQRERTTPANTTFRFNTTPYKVVARHAEQLGLIKEVSAGVRGAHGRVYRVNLPTPR